MARVERWLCDRCGRSSNGEGPLNWLGMSHDAGIVPPAAETMPGGGSFVTGPSSLRVYPLRRDPRPGGSSPEQHFCGLECAMVKIQNELRQMLERPCG